MHSNQSKAGVAILTTGKVGCKLKLLLVPGVVVHACNPALRWWRKEDHEFIAILAYIVRPYL
jgi:hypothetical protein